MTHSINELMSDKGVCRTAPATPGLLIMETEIPSKLFNLSLMDPGGWSVRNEVG